MNYTNYAGHKQDLSTIDHAHLSNIYWFNMICNNANGRQFKFIMDEIDRRFDGVILPYNPQWKFKQEIEFLEKSGRFRWNPERTRADIVEWSHGQIIGYYETPDYVRDKIINKLINE